MSPRPTTIDVVRGEVSRIIRTEGDYVDNAMASLVQGIAGSPRLKPIKRAVEVGVRDHGEWLIVRNYRPHG